MPVNAIQVEGVGKRYVIQHQSPGRYTTLRDTMVHGFKRFLKQSPSPHSSQEDFWALKDLSFEIKQGNVVGIIGRNGAGKSTLLKILSRITEPTTGRITLRGRVASLLEVGTGFHPELSGRENIFLNGAILGMTRQEIRRKFDEIVSFAEVEQFLDTPVKRYSSGMYVRLAFAVAAHLEPEILVVDEVLAVGDAHFQKKCLGRIESVANEGRTVLLVSHQMDVIKRLATVSMLLKNGTVAMFGQPDIVIQRYMSEADLLEITQEDSSSPVMTRIHINPVRLGRGDLEITVTYSSPRPIAKPTVGLVVHGPGGAPVFGSNTLMHPAPVQPNSLTRGSVSFMLPNAPLLTGDYTLSAWLNDGYVTLQHLPHTLAFSYQDPSPPEYHVDSMILGSSKITPTWTFL